MNNIKLILSELPKGNISYDSYKECYLYNLKLYDKMINIYAKYYKSEFSNIPDKNKYSFEIIAIGNNCQTSKVVLNTTTCIFKDELLRVNINTDNSKDILSILNTI